VTLYVPVCGVQAEQRTENSLKLRLNYLSEQHLGKVAVQVSPFCRDIFKIYELYVSLCGRLTSCRTLTLVHNIVTLQAEWEYICRFFTRDDVYDVTMIHAYTAAAHDTIISVELLRYRPRHPT